MSKPTPLRTRIVESDDATSDERPEMDAMQYVLSMAHPAQRKAWRELGYPYESLRLAKSAIDHLGQLRHLRPL